MLSWVKLKCSVFVLQKRCCLAILRRSNVFVDSRSFFVIIWKHLHYGNTNFKHCCDIRHGCVHPSAINKFFNEAKGVVLDFIDAHGEDKICRDFCQSQIRNLFNLEKGYCDLKTTVSVYCGFLWERSRYLQLPWYCISGTFSKKAESYIVHILVTEVCIPKKVSIEKIIVEVLYPISYIELQQFFFDRLKLLTQI